MRRSVTLTALCLLAALVIGAGEGCGKGGAADAGDSGPAPGALAGTVEYPITNVELDLGTSKEKATGEGLGPQGSVKTMDIKSCEWSLERKLSLQFGPERKSPLNGVTLMDYVITKLPFDGRKYYDYNFVPGNADKNHQLCARTVYKRQEVALCASWMPETSARCDLRITKESWRRYKTDAGNPVIDFEAIFWCKNMQFERVSETTRLVTHIGSEKNPGTLRVVACPDKTGL